jgi:hypothetical protein
VTEPEVLALARSLRRLGVAITLNPEFDEVSSPIHAWLYQIVCGFECEAGRCEDPDNPLHTCSLLDEMAAVAGWPDWFVGTLREARRGLRLLLAEADDQPPDLRQGEWSP